MKGKPAGDVVTLQLTRAQASLLCEAVYLARATRIAHANLVGQINMMQSVLDSGKCGTLEDLSKRLQPYALAVYPPDEETRKRIKSAVVPSKRRTR